MLPELFGSIFQVIPLEYLKDLHALHEEWLMTPDLKVPAQVLVVDVDQDLETVPELYEKIVSKVMKVIGTEPEPKKGKAAVPQRVLMSPIKSCVSPVVPAAIKNTPRAS